MKIFVGSGWFAPTSDATDVRKKLLGSSLTRTPDFHHVWLESVRQSIDPEYICIVDNRSPLASPLRGKFDIHWINLNVNLGHVSTPTSTNRSGWSDAVIHSARAFLETDADVFVYVEQTALLKSSRLGEWLRQQLGPNVGLVREGKGIPQPTTAGLFALHREHGPRFISRWEGIRHGDSRVSVERKLIAAASNCPLGVLNRTPGIANGRLVHAVSRLFRNHRWLPISGGRSRPIDWREDIVLKHPTRSELSRYFSETPLRRDRIPSGFW